MPTMPPNNPYARIVPYQSPQGSDRKLWRTWKDEYILTVSVQRGEYIVGTTAFRADSEGNVTDLVDTFTISQPRSHEQCIRAAGYTPLHFTPTEEVFKELGIDLNNIDDED